MPAPFSSPFVTIGGRRTCPCSSMVCCRHPTLRQFFPLLSPTAYFFPTASFLPPAGNFLPIAAERFTVVSAGFQPRCGVKIGALPRNRLASSATGSALPISPTARTGLIPHSLQCVIARALCARGNPYPRPPRPPLGKGAINPSDALRPSSYRISQCACWKNIFYQLSFIPNRIDCSFSFQRLSVWMTSSSVSVFGRICKMENWKNLYRSGCAQITSFISLLCPCSEST